MIKEKYGVGTHNHTQTQTQRIEYKRKIKPSSDMHEYVFGICGKPKIVFYVASQMNSRIHK